jgi:hypothetical protein
MATPASPEAAAVAAAIAALPRPVVLQCDMSVETAQKCIELTLDSLVTSPKVEKDQAMKVKKALEAWNGNLWGVVVGTSFGASVCHEVHNFILFRVGKIHIMCFSSFDEASLVTEKKAVVRAVKKEEEVEETQAE